MRELLRCYSWFKGEVKVLQIYSLVKNDEINLKGAKLISVHSQESVDKVWW